MTSWSIDMGDLAAAQQGEAVELSAPRAAFVHEVVEAATSRRGEDAWCSAVRCVVRRGSKTCGARVQVALVEAGRIEWSCAACEARGVITGFAGTELDRSPYLPGKKKLRVFGVDDEGREALRAATVYLPALGAVIARARPAEDVPELLVIEATADELDELYSLVEQLLDTTMPRRRRALLDGVLSDLCTAMDGF